MVVSQLRQSLTDRQEVTAGYRCCWPRNLSNRHCEVKVLYTVYRQSCLIVTTGVRDRRTYDATTVLPIARAMNGSNEPRRLLDRHLQRRGTFERGKTNMQLRELERRGFYGGNLAIIKLRHAARAVSCSPGGRTFTSRVLFIRSRSDTAAVCKTNYRSHTIARSSASAVDPSFHGFLALCSAVTWFASRLDDAHPLSRTFAPLEYIS